MYSMKGCSANRGLRVVLDGKSSQEYLGNAGVHEDFILGPTLFFVYINDLPDDITSNIAFFADDITLYSKCDQTSDLWQEIELILNLNMTYETLMTRAGSDLFISMLEKLSLFCLTSKIILVLLM